MRIDERITRVRDFALNPYIEPKTHFEVAWLNSVKDFTSDGWKHWVNPENYIKDLSYQRGLSYSVNQFGRNNIILYSGGKESFLTKAIFDYFKVPYKLAIVKEINGYEGPEINSFVDENIKADIVLESELFHLGAIAQFGRHLPAVYYYTLLLLKGNPGATIWVGAEYSTPEWCHQNYNFDQHDVMFSDINFDRDVNGNVYSCVTPLKEFDIYRIVRDCYDYDVKYSTYDNPNKAKRLEVFEDMNNLMKKINSSDCSKYLLMELSPFFTQTTLMKPFIYDFRQDIVDFLKQFDDFNRITKKV